MIFQVKKLSALILSFALCFNLCATAFAAETELPVENEPLILQGAAIAASIVQATTATANLIVQSAAQAPSLFINLLDEFCTFDEDVQALYGSGRRFAQAISESSSFSDVGDIIIQGVMNGKIYRFIEWLRNEKGIIPGSAPVAISQNNGLLLADGSLLPFVPFLTDGSFVTSDSSYVLVSPTDTGVFTYKLSTGYSISYTPNGSNSVATKVLDPSGSVIKSRSSSWPQALGVYNGVLCLAIFDGTKYMYSIYNDKLGTVAFVQSSESFSLDPLEQFQDIPSEIPNNQGLTIDTGISDLDTSDPQATADTIFQFIINGDYAPTVSVDDIPGIYNPQITASQFSVTSTTFTSSVSLTGFDPSGSYRLYYDLALSEDIGDTSSSISKGYSNQIGIVSGVSDYTGYHRFTDLTPNTEYYLAWTVEDMTTGVAVPVVASITFTTSSAGSSDDSPGILLMILNKVSEILDKMNGGQSEGILASINDKLDSLIDTVANQYERELEDNFKDSLSGVNENFFSDTGKGQGVTVSDVVDLADTQGVFKDIFSGDYGFSDFLYLFSDDGFFPWFSSDTAMNLNPTAYDSPSVVDLDDPYNMQSYYDNVEKVRNKSND